MEADHNVILNAFPTVLSDDVHTILKEVPLTSSIKPAGSFKVLVHGEPLQIPYRVYYDDLHLLYENQLTPSQSKILYCLFTRHHNGYIREQHLQQLLSSYNDEIWVLPFVMRLLGEYVIEILQVINSNIRLFDKNNILSFINDNPDFFQTTERRVISYWNEYYRNLYPNKQDYVGFQIIDYLKSIIQK